MSKLKPDYELDYSFSGDNIDEFGRGYITNQKQLFVILNAMRKNQLIPNVEPEAYEFKIEGDVLYVRDKDNTEWIKLFTIAENGGLKGKNVGKSYAGAANNMPTTGLQDYDSYLSLDDGRYFYWKNNRWNLVLSKNVKDLDGYGNLVEKDSDTVAPVGNEIVQLPQKIVRTNNNGVLPVDIAGNAAKIAGIPIKTHEINDGELLIYDEKNNIFTNVEPKKLFSFISTAGLLNFYLDDEGYLCAEFNKEALHNGNAIQS